MVNSLLINNAKIYNDKSELFVDILIEDAKVKQFVNNSSEYVNIPRLDVQNKIVTPGLIDVHIQGAGGADVLDNTFEALDTISKTLVKYGVTGFLATTVLNPAIHNEHLKKAAESYNTKLSGASLLGIHLEGPFINPDKLGGIAKSAVMPPSLKTFDEIYEVTGDALKMMTVAPEIKGSDQIIKRLSDLNIVASFGHSLATSEETKKGFDLGLSHVTHLFNAMPAIHHRDPGPIPAILNNQKISTQVICDGVHIHKEVVNMVYNCIGGERCICITDGIQAIGLPDGKYFYNGKEYWSKNGTARYTDGTLIGTAKALNEIVVNFMNYTNCTFEEAINTATINPAKLLNINQSKGTLEIGAAADLIIWDEGYSVNATIKNGRIVYQK